MTTSSLEARVAHLEGIVGQIDTRLARIESRMDRLDDRITALDLRMQSNFRWLVGILLGTMIPVWVSVILAILLKG